MDMSSSKRDFEDLPLRAMARASWDQVSTLEALSCQTESRAPLEHPLGAVCI